MNVGHREWEGEHPGEVLSLYVDGYLMEAERRTVERHLADCRACRNLTSELKELTALTRDLPDRRPEADLWPGISAWIDAVERGASNQDGAGGIPAAGGRSSGDPIERPTRLSSHLGQKMRVGVWQLVAAAMVVALLSGGLTWLLVRDGAGTTESLTVPTAFENGRSSPAPASTAGVGALSSVEKLEARYREARGRLDPDTRARLDRNLHLIDRAIEDANRALEERPENRYMQRHLAQAVRKKARFLSVALQIARTS